MAVIKLPSGLKLNGECFTNKSDFYEVLAIHYPFSKMQKDRRDKAIGLDWKAYQKALGKNDTPKTEPKGKADDK